MINLFLDWKIKKELKEFKQFKANYRFKMKELKITDNKSVFFDDVCIRNGEDGMWVGEGENFVNVGYIIHGSAPKVLSNLFQYTFYFKGHKVNSIESIFQSFKFKDRRKQKLLFSYFGLPSNHIKATGEYDWKKDKIIYFMGKPMKRNSKQYADFIDELYISALQNPLFRQAIRNVGNKYILHAMGETSRELTSFTREEYEFELNCLKDFVISKK